MKFAIAVHGTRGDIEPALAAALALHRRGHEVRLAVPPNLMTFATASGLTPSASYGPDSAAQLETELIRKGWTPRNPARALRQARQYLTEGWMEMSETLLALANGADAILTGTTYQELSGNVAEAMGLPMAALHYFPFRANNHILPLRLPMSVVGPLWSVAEWTHWQILKPADDQQRRRLGLPRSTTRAVGRLLACNTLEIQAYDRALFPGLEQQWGGRRPLTGALTLEIAHPGDPAVENWIRSGSPPIYFGFGSMPIEHPENTISMIIDACRELGERAIICSGTLPLAGMSPGPDIMIVPMVKHSDVFPLCRAVVHHGGAGTTAAGLRAGAPTLILWVAADQPIWGMQVRRLGVGSSRSLAATTPESLRQDLMAILTPQCSQRARDIASKMTSPAKSMADTADLLEQLVLNPIRRR